jgi:hypothetical protein
MELDESAYSFYKKADQCESCSVSDHTAVRTYLSK